MDCPYWAQPGGALAALGRSTASDARPTPHGNPPRLRAALTARREQEDVLFWESAGLDADEYAASFDGDTRGRAADGAHQTECVAKVQAGERLNKVGCYPTATLEKNIDRL